MLFILRYLNIRKLVQSIINIQTTVRKDIILNIFKNMGSTLIRQHPIPNHFSFSFRTFFFFSSLYCTDLSPFFLFFFFICSFSSTLPLYLLLLLLFIFIFFHFLSFMLSSSSSFFFNFFFPFFFIFCKYPSWWVSLVFLFSGLDDQWVIQLE